MPGSPALAFYLLARRSDPATEAVPDWPVRPEGKLVWFHAGQALPTPAVTALARRLKSARPGLNVLFTSSARRFPPVAAGGVASAGFRVPVPAERTGAVDRFLQYWRPDLGVWTECDLRPALVRGSARAGVPLIMLDAGTARPHQGAFRWRPGMTRALMSAFSHVLAGDAEALDDFRRMGVRGDRLEHAGRLEEAGVPLPCNPAEHEAMVELLGGRQLWLAHRVTPEEANAAISAHRRLRAYAHRLLLVLRPADPAQGPLLARRLRDEGWSVGLRSAGDEPEAQVQIFLADSDDEDGLWFRLAPVSFLGSSLYGGPGCDPFEPAALGSAILHGPSVPAHAEACARLARAGGARMVQNETELFHALEELLAPDQAARMAQAAWELASAGAEVTDRAIEIITEMLDHR
jgi:3-deoxy-D-manno-octulosonic-acid transferase